MRTISSGFGTKKASVSSISTDLGYQYFTIICADLEATLCHTREYFFSCGKEPFGGTLTMIIFHGEKSKVCKHFSLVITFDLRESWELLLLELLFWGEFWLLF